MIQKLRKRSFKENVMKYILIFIHVFIISSCQEKKNGMNCAEKITVFNYPADIELLEDQKYVCDSLVLDRFKILFSDKNYILAEYDLRTRLLYDKRQDLWLVFKAGEVNNFYFNKPEYNNIYGLNNIYVLDNSLMPLYSFNKQGLRKYKLNDEKKITESVEIKLQDPKISYNIDTIDYSGILKIASELKNGSYKEAGNWKEEYYYKDPPVWSDL